MKRCIDLAKNGFGRTYPNPMVGCVIVHDGLIVAEGWHQRAGEPHAEVHAVNNLKDNSLIKKSTLYVSLEPCSHFGKTPPCSDLIIEKGFKKVVIGMTDPFAQVRGKGIQKLMTNGCDVIVGVCEEECFELNKRFITFHEKQRPYVILKWAQSKDGFLSPFEFGRHKSQEPVWLTNAFSKQKVHQWRSQEQAIMVGTHTALMDDPALTTRLWKGQNPTRVLIDKELKVPESAKIFSPEAQTLVFTKKKPRIHSSHIEYCEIDFNQNIIPHLLKALHERNIQSLIVEGGLLTLQSFINQNLWDEARVFRSNTLLHEGTAAPKFDLKHKKTEYLLDDELKFYNRENGYQ